MKPLLLSLLFAGLAPAAEPLLEREFIFAPQKLHSHSSSIVQLGDGRFLTCWYIGSGERTADDVKVEAAYFDPKKKAWSAPFTLGDTPGFPDTNPILFVDKDQRLWSLYTPILDNHWETALLQLRISARGWKSAPIRWDLMDNILLIPKDFAKQVEPILRRQIEKAPESKERLEAKMATKRLDDKLGTRLGWMPRIHPLQLPSGRVLVPLYTDNYSVSLIAITDDGGRTWRPSAPIVGLGAVQPSLVRKKDGTLVAYMRDNGPPPQRVLVSESKDDGETWSEALDSDIPNPGSSVEVIATREGRWVMALNDTEKGRQRLSLWMSDDEGKTWRWKRAVEDETEGGYSYPSLIQARDGSLHLTYSHSRRPAPGEKELQTIRHVRTNLAWIEQGR